MEENKAGFAQMFFKRLAFVDFCNAMVKASTAAYAEEVRTKIAPKLMTIKSYVAEFGNSPTSAAAIGAVLSAGDHGDDEDGGNGGVPGMHGEGSV